MHNPNSCLRNVRVQSSSWVGAECRVPSFSLTKNGGNLAHDVFSHFHVLSQNENQADEYTISLPPGQQQSSQRTESFVFCRRHSHVPTWHATAANTKKRSFVLKRNYSKHQYYANSCARIWSFWLRNVNEKRARNRWTRVFSGKKWNDEKRWKKKAGTHTKTSRTFVLKKCAKVSITAPVSKSSYIIKQTDRIHRAAHIKKNERTWLVQKSSESTSIVSNTTAQ